MDGFDCGPNRYDRFVYYLLCCSPHFCLMNPYFWWCKGESERYTDIGNGVVGIGRDGLFVWRDDLLSRLVVVSVNECCE